jgi:hypothetical protein
VNAYRVDPLVFSSIDAFTDCVGRHHEIEEFICYWPTDPATLAERDRALERVSLDVLAKLRA